MKDKALLMFASVQPFIWWGVYNIFQVIAKKHYSETGLGFCCGISASVIMLLIIVPIVDKYSDK